MKITKAMKKQLQSTKKSQNLIIRGRIIWIDFQKGKERLRKSTKLKYSPVAFNFVKKNYEKYLENGAEIWLKKEFENYENSLTQKRLEKLDFPKEKPFKPLSFDKLIDDFLAEKSLLKFSTKRTISSHISKIKCFLKSKKIENVFDFERKHSLDFANFLIKNGISSKMTFHQYFSTLNSILNLAIKQEILSQNVLFLPKVSMLKEAQKCPFSLDEVELLLKNSTGSLNIYLYIAFFTGMRLGEIFALTWGDIDFEKKEISVTKTLDFITKKIGSPKTASSYRVIDLLEVLEKKLYSLRKDSSLPVIDFNVNKIRTSYKTLLKSLNLKYRVLYNTRHTFASIMLSRGEEPMWVGCKMLGHKNLNETFKSYAKYLPKNVVERAKFLDELRL
ncbi:MAG: tyrosine-type recombinase/integrase [Campylobacter sp.]|nr:tyrosine-type recombinase/integrase [Campylobacteraceae bacterium]MDY4120980.1 tyrosine-type recombinase/integrase [Campylobacter sp.]MDY4445973.1 tyrosine-type recombinase/integrase [Campylobacter sp.]